MDWEYREQFHKARREEQRLEAALHVLDAATSAEEGDELLKYISYRKRSAVQMLIRQGNLAGIRAMDQRGWIEAQYVPGYRDLAAKLREMEIWAYLYPTEETGNRGRTPPERGQRMKSQKTGAGNLDGGPGQGAGDGELGRAVWSLTMKKLRIKLPGFAGALASMGFQADKTVHYLAGDGFVVHFGRQEVLRRFSREPDALARDYMHLFLHNLYFHPVLSKGRREDIWNLACDIAVEEILDGFEVRELRKSGRDRRLLLLKEAGLPEKSVSAEQIYQILEKKRPAEKEMDRLAEAFRADEHTLWREYRQEERQAPPAEGEEGERGGFYGDRTAKSVRFLQKWMKIRKEYSRRTDDHHQRAGNQAGTGRQAVKLTGRGTYDYRNFLERFMVSGEEVELDLDSFDYITYWYSRNHYDGVVLMEPLEYREIHRMREMVIAVDTSGSCSGRVVRQFLEETYRILSERENFFRKMEVHLIQCDSMIQEHVVIRSEEEFLDYMEHVTVKGLGGTDFRPVFELTDQMISRKELRDLGGLLYFTDGDGVYPSKAPAYDAAFVFLNDAYEKHEIPDWAIRLNLHLDLWEE